MFFFGSLFLKVFFSCSECSSKGFSFVTGYFGGDGAGIGSCGVCSLVEGGFCGGSSVGHGGCV
jgi:hypothetical protein